MTMKLIQKHLLKGTREFEIVDDAVNVRIKTPFKEEKFTVILSILNPEPVVNKSYLEFHSRVKCGALLSLFLNKPNVGEFNNFVSELKQRALKEYSTFAGIKVPSQPSVLPGNVYEEPPEFEESGPRQVRKNRKLVNVEQVEISIQELKTYLDTKDVKPFLSALEALKTEPQNESHLLQVVNTFNDLGHEQGAILTYAPYVRVLLSDDDGDPF